MGARRQFNGRTVVVTGAAGGLGRAFCHRFGRAGAALGLLDLEAGPLEDLRAELTEAGIRSLPVVCDVTDPEACREAMDRILVEFGGIDVLFNNAGLTHLSPMKETGLATYRKVMDVNFFGTVHCTQAALDPLVRSRGLVITISSVAGFVPLFHRTGYAASKHALHGFFGSLRVELKGTGVDVLLVCPGFTATGIADNALGGDGKPARESQSTVGRIASPEQVANATFRAASRSDSLLVLSAVGRLTYFLARFWPSLYERIMLRSLSKGVDSP